MTCIFRVKPLSLVELQKVFSENTQVERFGNLTVKTEKLWIVFTAAGHHIRVLALRVSSITALKRHYSKKLCVH